MMLMFPTTKSPLSVALALVAAIAVTSVSSEPLSSYGSEYETELIQQVEAEFEQTALAIGQSVYPQKCTTIESGVCKTGCVYSGYESLPDTSSCSATSVTSEFIDAELCGACHGVNHVTNAPTLYGISGATRAYDGSSSSSSASLSSLSGIEPSSDPYDGSEGAQTRAVDEDACWTRGTDSLLASLHAKFPGKLMWTSYVAASGVSRVYPGLLRQADTMLTAESWYSAALAGPKDVVFLLDRSDSVKRNKVWDKAKYLVDRMIDTTLSAADHVALFAVSGSPHRLGDNPPKNTLERATAAVRYSLKTSFCRSGGGGGSRLSVALTRAISLLTTSANENVTSGCAAHIVLVSDADINEMTGKIMKELRKAAKRFGEKVGRPLHIHVYGLGKYVEEGLIRKITCQHNGIFVRIGKNEEVKDEHARAWLNYVVAERTVAMTVPSLAPKRRVAWSSFDYLGPSNRMGSVISVPVFSSINKPYKVNII